MPKKWDIVYLTSSPLVHGSGPEFYQPVYQLNIKEERETFFGVLAQSQKSLTVTHMQGTTQSFINAVTGGCRIIHYSGHGFPGYLAFEDSGMLGSTHLMRDGQIRSICSNANIEFAFAAACHSEQVGRAFVAAGIPHVVAVDTNFEVSDEAAQVFCKHFYASLLNGWTIKRSFKHAESAVFSLASDARTDSDTFRLLPESGNHDKILFDPSLKNIQSSSSSTTANLSSLSSSLKQNTMLIDLTEPIPPNNLGGPVPNFMGRHVDIHKIIQALVYDNNVKLLAITGPPGVGKSSTALMTAKYLCDRHVFSGGCLHIDVIKMQKIALASKRHYSLMDMTAYAMLECPNHEFVLPITSNEIGTIDVTNDVLGQISQTKRILFILDGLDEFGFEELFESSVHLLDVINEKPIIYDHPRLFKTCHGLINKKKFTSSKHIQEIIFTFLKKIISQSTSDSKILVTSTKPIENVVKFDGYLRHSYELKPLSQNDSANLFSSMMSEYRPSDILEKHEKLLDIVKGNPYLIREMVLLQVNSEINDLNRLGKEFQRLVKKKWIEFERLKERKEKEKLAKKQEAFMRVNIKDRNAMRLWRLMMDDEDDLRHENGMIKYVYGDELLKIFSHEFIENTQSTRIFERKSLSPFLHKWGMRTDTRVHIQKFDTIYKYFSGICTIVSAISSIWNEENPTYIQGFMSRLEAEQRLRSTKIPVGCFLIRFGTSFLKSIVITYVKQDRPRIIGHVKGILVDLPDEYAGASHQSMSGYIGNEMRGHGTRRSVSKSGSKAKRHHSSRRKDGIALSRQGKGAHTVGYATSTSQSRSPSGSGSGSGNHFNHASGYGPASQSYSHLRRPPFPLGQPSSQMGGLLGSPIHSLRTTKGDALSVSTESFLVDASMTSLMSMRSFTADAHSQMNEHGIALPLMDDGGGKTLPNVILESDNERDSCESSISDSDGHESDDLKTPLPDDAAMPAAVRAKMNAKRLDRARKEKRRREKMRRLSMKQFVSGRPAQFDFDLKTGPMTIGEFVNGFTSISILYSGKGRHVPKKLLKWDSL